MSPAKVEVRKHMRGLFSQVTKETLLEKSEELSSKLLEFVKKDLTLGAYYPLEDEALWFINWDVNKVRLAFPRVGTDTMRFILSSLDELKDWSQAGISFKAPPEQNPEVIPDVMIIPGRAFDEKGNRLGRGKGFYDKYLADFRGIKIGICFDFQVIEDIPLEPHDRPMDFVVTERRILKME